MKEVIRQFHKKWEMQNDKKGVSCKIFTWSRALLKRGTHEACNNIRSCKMTITWPPTLATNVYEHEKHEKVHLKPCYASPQRKKLQNNHKEWDWKTTNMIKNKMQEAHLKQLNFLKQLAMTKRVTRWQQCHQLHLQTT